MKYSTRPSLQSPFLTKVFICKHQTLQCITNYINSPNSGEMVNQHSTPRKTATMSDSLFEPEWTFIARRTRSRDATHPGASATTSAAKNIQGVALSSINTRSEFSDNVQNKSADSSFSYVLPDIGIEESICIVETPANEQKSKSALSKCAPSISADDEVPVASTPELHQRFLLEVENEAIINADTASGAVTAVRHLKLPIGAEKNQICIPEHASTDDEEGSTTPRPNHAQSPGVFDAVTGTYAFEVFKNPLPEAEDPITTGDTESRGAASRNYRTSGPSTMAATVCAIGKAQGGPNTGSAPHGTLPSKMEIGTVVDLRSTCRNQDEEVPQTTGTPRLLGDMARIRLQPVLLKYLGPNPLPMLAAKFLSHLRSNSHRVQIALLLLILPLLVRYISGCVDNFK